MPRACAGTVISTRVPEVALCVSYVVVLGHGVLSEVCWCVAWTVVSGECAFLGLVQCWVWLTAWKQWKSLTGWLSLFLGHLWRVLLHLSENIQSDRPSLTRATWCVLSTRVPEVALCVSYVVVLGHGVLSEVCWCVAWTVVSGECAFLGLVQCWVWLTAWKQWKSLTGWLSLFLGHLWRVLPHLSENIQSDRPSLTRATWCVLSNAVCMCWDS